jgi:hypothetical protein
MLGGVGSDFDGPGRPPKPRWDWNGRYNSC